MNGHDGLSTDRHRVNMAFSIEEAPCRSTGFFTYPILFPGYQVKSAVLNSSSFLLTALLD
jgi:hypothetical protein